MKHPNRFLFGLLGGVAAFAGTAQAADGVVLKNRSIAYVMTYESKEIYNTPDGKQECPVGLNEGPREQFKMLYPEVPGKTYKLTETQLAREAEIWFPNTTPDPIPYRYAVGPTAFGLNLDGKIGPNDFTNPEGEKGVDNQLQRAWGCQPTYRSGSFNLMRFNDWRKYQYNTIVIEITGVDSLANDDDVTLTTYRGRDKIMTDATGATYLAGATQRLDERWGKPFIQKFHGKIANGVLTTDGADYLMPSAGNGGSITDIRYYNIHWRLNLTQDQAKGVMAGYMDIDDWNAGTNQIRSTHHQAYDKQATPSIYRAMRKLADYRPDPATGENTAISMASRVGFTQVFAIHAPAAVSATDASPDAKAAQRE